MKRGETKNICINLNTTVDTYKTIQVVLKQGYQHLLIIGNEDIKRNGTSIHFSLSQKQTLEFDEGNYELQVRAVDTKGNAYCSDVFTGYIGKCLDDSEVM